MKLKPKSVLYAGNTRREERRAIGKIKAELGPIRVPYRMSARRAKLVIVKVDMGLPLCGAQERCYARFVDRVCGQS